MNCTCVIVRFEDGTALAVFLVFFLGGRFVEAPVN